MHLFMILRLTTAVFFFLFFGHFVDEESRDEEHFINQVEWEGYI